MHQHAEYEEDQLRYEDEDNFIRPRLSPDAQAFVASIIAANNRNKVKTSYLDLVNGVNY